MRDQAFDAAQRFGQGETFQAFDERAHDRLFAHAFNGTEFDAEHRAEAMLLACGERVAPETLIKGADQAMYVDKQARKSGKVRGAKPDVLEDAP